MRNLKSISKCACLFKNRSTETFSGVLIRRILTSNDLCKFPGRRNLQLTTSVENKQMCSRSIHSSAANWSSAGNNQRSEEMKNYITFGAIGGVCLMMYLYSLTMKAHEDYVVVTPDPKKNKL